MQAIDDLNASSTTRRRQVRKLPMPSAAVQPPSTRVVAHEREDILSAIRFEPRHSPVARPSRYQCHFYEHIPRKHERALASRSNAATASFSSSAFTTSCIMHPTASWQRRSSSPREASRSGASPQWPRDNLCHSQTSGPHWVWDPTRIDEAVGKPYEPPRIVLNVDWYGSKLGKAPGHGVGA